MSFYAFFKLLVKVLTRCVLLCHAEFFLDKKVFIEGLGAIILGICKVKVVVQWYTEKIKFVQQFSM